MKKCLALLWLVLAAACSTGEYSPYPEGLGQQPAEYLADVVVTVKQAEDGTVFFQQGKGERLFPIGEFPFEGQCRAIGSVTIYAEEVPLYGHKAKVHWMEPLEFGAFLLYPSGGQGTDGLDILTESWVTSVSDGYLTIHYKTWWGEPASRHTFTLVQGSDPFELTLFHDAAGDAKDTYSEGIIYFDINSLPQTEDSPHALKLNWTNTNGEAVSADFEFESRT